MNFYINCRHCGSLKIYHLVSKTKYTKNLIYKRVNDPIYYKQKDSQLGPNEAPDVDLYYCLRCNRFFDLLVD